MYREREREVNDNHTNDNDNTNDTHNNTNAINTNDNNTYNHNTNRLGSEASPTGMAAPRRSTARRPVGSSYRYSPHSIITITG